MAASVRKFIILIFVKASFFPQEFYEKVNVYKTFFSREEAALPTLYPIHTKDKTCFNHVYFEHVYIPPVHTNIKPVLMKVV